MDAEKAVDRKREDEGRKRRLETENERHTRRAVSSNLRACNRRKDQGVQARYLHGTAMVACDVAIDVSDVIPDVQAHHSARTLLP